MAHDERGLTAKQEAFALAYVETGNASEAYRIAYDVGEKTKPETIWKRSCELMADRKVSGRVYELQQVAAERSMVTVESITKELDEARDHALLDPKGASAAVSAVMGKAKVHGLLIDRAEVESTFRVTIAGPDADL